jgi:hypothetical protein
MIADRLEAGSKLRKLRIVVEIEDDAREEATGFNIVEPVASRMLPPRENNAAVTRATIPGWLGQETVKRYEVSDTRISWIEMDGGQGRQK